MSKNIFEQAKKILRGSRRTPPKFDWRDSSAKKEYVRTLKRNRRVMQLDYLVPDRKCPICGEVKVSSRQWVVIDILLIINRWDSIAETVRKHSKEGQSAICRGCFMKYEL